MIMIISGSRADYACLRWVIEEMTDQSMEFRLVELKTNSIDDGFSVSIQIRTEIQIDRPDAIMILGDRWELLPVIFQATINRIPIIHIGGGEVSQGSYDNMIRNAISKMSQYHFVVNENAKKRLNEIGEFNNIWVVGSPRLDYLGKIKLIEKEKVPLIIYHPETLESLDTIKKQTKIFFDAIEEMNFQDYNLFYPNNDRGSEIIIDEIKKRKLKVIDKILTVEEWVDKLFNCNIMIGNSSAGIMEAQIFDKPVVNVGNRQKGRWRCGNVWDVGYNKENIKIFIDNLLTFPDVNVNNVYGNGTASKTIVEVLRSIKKFEVKK